MSGDHPPQHFSMKEIGDIMRNIFHRRRRGGKSAKHLHGRTRNETSLPGEWSEVTPSVEEALDEITAGNTTVVLSVDDLERDLDDT